MEAIEVSRAGGASLTGSSVPLKGLALPKEVARDRPQTVLDTQIDRIREANIWLEANINRLVDLITRIDGPPLPVEVGENVIEKSHPGTLGALVDEAGRFEENVNRLRKEFDTLERLV